MILLVFAPGYWTRNDQRSSCIIDQYAIGFIHHGKVMFALHHFFRGMNHVITEIIKAKFIIRSVGDVGEIGFSPVITIGLVLVNTINGDTKPFENCSVPFLVTTGEVIIYGDDMYSFTGQCIQVGG